MITIPVGQAVSIPIYNAAQTGPLTFLISFSGSIALSVAAAVALAGTQLLFV